MQLVTSQLYTPPSAGIQEINWPRAKDHPFFYIGIYALISLSGVAITMTNVITQFTGALRASRVLFKQLLVSVVRATMRWHDVTPQGEKDYIGMSTID